MSALGEKDRLGNEAIGAVLQELSGWSLSNDGLKLQRTLLFEDFVSAFGFLAQAAIVAQAMDHHPEWSNVWNRVDISLATHTAKGVTVRDIELARKIDAIARHFPLQCGIGSEDCGGCG